MSTDSFPCTDEFSIVGDVRPRSLDPLTARELQIVRLVARGRTNEELAAELYVTLATVKTHLANVQRKLAVRNRVEIAAWAWRTGVCTA